MAEFGQAMAAMYTGQDAESRKQADRWLQHFSTTAGAWDIAHAVLSNPHSDPSSPHTLFAVKTLHDKILCDFDDLGPDQRLALREAISTHLLHIGLRPGVPRPVVKRLALCAAALAVQMQWSEVFGYVTALSSRMPPGQEINGIRLVMEILSALPDQCEDSYLSTSDDSRDAFRAVLERHIPDVMTFLAQTAARPEVLANVEAATALLQCLRNWVAPKRQT